MAVVGSDTILISKLHLSWVQREFRVWSRKGGILDKENGKRRIVTQEEHEAWLAGVDRAMRRAAVEARQRAIDTNGYVETWRDGKMVRDTEV